MLILRYWMRLSIAFVVRFKAILFIGIIMGLLLFAVLKLLFPFFTRNTERIGITGRYHTDELPNEVLNLISNGLTKVNEEGKLEPNLAESWQEENEGKVWIFTLKDNLKWQDGSEVTSKTINYSFNDVKIEKPDKRTIVFILQNKFAPFPYIVSKPIFKRGLLGTGEWKVNKITLTNEYVEKLYLTNDSGSRKIINFYPSEERTKLAFKLGIIDSIYDLIDPTPFNNWNTVTVKVRTSYNRYVAIFFNNQDPSFKDNKTFRQALSYAIDKDAFGLERAIGPINPKSWAFNPQIKRYDYDKNKALKLLEEIPQETKKNLSVKLVTTPALLPIAEKVAKYWKDIEVKTTVQVSAILPSEYQAFLAIYEIPPDPDQYATWHSTQKDSNISKYSNPRIDKLLEDGRLKLKEEERKKIYLDFQRFLLEDAPAIFLYHPISYTVVRK